MTANAATNGTSTTTPAPAPATPASPQLRVWTPSRIYNPLALTLDEMLKISNQLARAELKTSNPQQIFAKILYGQEVGLGPMQAVDAVHIVDEKPTLDASYIAGKIKASGKYDYDILEHDDSHCSISFKLVQDDKVLGISTFSLSDAERAKLLGKKTQTWEKYPRNMTFSRAITNGQAWFCPDVLGGRVNTPEEMGAVVTVDEQGVQHVVTGEGGQPLLDTPAGAVDTSTGEVLPVPPASNVHELDPALIALRSDISDRKISAEVVTRVLRGFGVERITALPPERIEAFRKALFGAARQGNAPKADDQTPRAARHPRTHTQHEQPPKPSDDQQHADVTARIRELALPAEILTKMIVEASNGKARTLEDPKLTPDALFRLQGRLKALQTTPPPANEAPALNRVNALRDFTVEHNLRDRVQQMLADLGVKTLADVPPTQWNAFEEKVRASVKPDAAAKIGTPAHLRRN